MEPLDRKERDIQANRDAGLISPQEAEQQLGDLERYRREQELDPSHGRGSHQAPARQEERGPPDDPSEPSLPDSQGLQGGEGGPDPSGGDQGGQDGPREAAEGGQEPPGEDPGGEGEAGGSPDV